MSSAKHLTSLDVFRGLTIVLMIMVNSPGNNTPYSFLSHAAWNGFTLADVVFPWFIFIVGISAALGLHAARFDGKTDKQLLAPIVQRSIQLFALGLLINAFPYHFDLNTIRVLGVLQRIALCYLFTAIIFLTTSATTQRLIAASLLLSYGLILYQFGEQVVAHVDHMLLGPAHLYTPSFDPEGLLSTLPCFALALLGNLTGIGLLAQKSPQQKAAALFFTGLAAAIIGFFMSYALALNKNLMTPSTVVLTAGLGLLVLSALYTLIEIKHQSAWYKPFQLFGRHALLIYILHVLGLKIQALLGLRLWITAHLFFWAAAPNAALLYAICYTVFWYYVLLALTHVKIKIFPRALAPNRL